MTLTTRKLIVLAMIGAVLLLGKHPARGKLVDRQRRGGLGTSRKDAIPDWDRRHDCPCAADPIGRP